MPKSSPDPGTGLSGADPQGTGLQGTVLQGAGLQVSGPPPSRHIWLSVFCCEMFVVEPGSDKDDEARRKGMILVAEEDVETVRQMSMFGRRQWGLDRMVSDA